MLDNDDLDIQGLVEANIQLRLAYTPVLVRYETSLQNWLALHWLVFTVLLLRKITPPPTS